MGKGTCTGSRVSHPGVPPIFVCVTCTLDLFLFIIYLFSLFPFFFLLGLQLDELSFSFSLGKRSPNFHKTLTHRHHHTRLYYKTEGPSPPPHPVQHQSPPPSSLSSHSRVFPCRSPTTKPSSNSGSSHRYGRSSHTSTDYPASPHRQPRPRPRYDGSPNQMHPSTQRSL